jgi:hypothetical protein
MIEVGVCDVAESGSPSLPHVNMPLPVASGASVAASGGASGAASQAASGLGLGGFFHSGFSRDAAGTQSACRSMASLKKNSGDGFKTEKGYSINSLNHWG